jgi:hypothetical protein
MAAPLPFFAEVLSKRAGPPLLKGGITRTNPRRTSAYCRNRYVLKYTK